MAQNVLQNDYMNNFSYVINDNFEQLFNRSNLIANGTAYILSNLTQVSEATWFVKIWQIPSNSEADADEEYKECFIEMSTRLSLLNQYFGNSGWRQDWLNGRTNPSTSVPYPNPYYNLGGSDGSGQMQVLYPQSFNVSTRMVQFEFTETPVELPTPRTNRYACIPCRIENNTTLVSGRYSLIRPYPPDLNTPPINAYLDLFVSGKGKYKVL